MLSAKKLYENGLLVIKPETSVLYIDPAKIYKVRKNFLKKSPICLYETPALSENQAVNDYFFDHSKNQGLIIKKELQPGEVVIACRLPDPYDPNKPHPFLMQVITFKRIPIKEDACEHHIEIIDTGYMHKNDLMTQTDYKKNKQQLFKKLPEKNDVIQVLFGNCFLLATINSILSHERGINFILHMMEQQKDKSIIVRLFDPHSVSPCHVRIENINQSEMLSLPHQEVWIDILEKAYASLVLKNIFNTNEMNQYLKCNEFIYHSFLSVYGKGGDPALAFKIITGHESKKINIIIPETEKSPFSMKDMKLLNSLMKKIYRHFLFTLGNPNDHFDELKKMAKDNQPHLILNKLYDDLSHATYHLENLLLESSLYKALNRNKNLLFQLGTYLLMLEYFYPNNKLIKKFYIHSENDSDAILKKLELLTNLNPSPPADVIDVLKNYICNGFVNEFNQKIYAYSSSYLLSGKYTEYELHIYNRIKHLIEIESVLVASTHPQISDKIAGLISSHGYSIMACVEKKLPNNEMGYFIKLSNPLRGIGRIYKRNLTGFIGVKSKEHPAFDLEINEFVKYFTAFTVGSL